MKYERRFVAMALFAVALASFALLIHTTLAQLERKEPKFKPAPAGVKGIRADEWTISLDTKLTSEEFERELERILIQYDAKLLTAEAAYGGSPTKMAKRFDTHSAQIQAPEVRARQIAEDEMVIEVAQIHELDAAPASLTDLKQNGQTGQDSGKAPLPGQPPSKKRPKPRRARVIS
jgi:hypothetical protein